MSDSLNIIASGVLQKYRFTLVGAEKYISGKIEKGQLSTNIRLGVADGLEENSLIPLVHMTILGLGAKSGEEAPYFRIEVKIEAFFSWDAAPDAAEIRADEEALTLLCRPVYTLAAIEAKSLAFKMGLSDFSTPLDLSSAIRGSQKRKLPEGGKSARKTAGKPSRLKTSEKKTTKE